MLMEGGIPEPWDTSARSLIRCSPDGLHAAVFFETELHEGQAASTLGSRADSFPDGFSAKHKTDSRHCRHMGPRGRRQTTPRRYSCRGLWPPPAWTLHLHFRWLLALQIYRAERLKFSSGETFNGTPEE